MALSLTLNGEQRLFKDLATGATVLDLLTALQLKGDRVALEHNGDLAARSAWGVTTLSEGDRIEIVHFVGGGNLGG